jgi:Protein of unknown function (DUF1353)
LCGENVRLLTYAALLIGLFFSQVCLAQEYFGEFPDPLKGEFVEAKPRPKFKLAAQFRFSDPNGLLWSVPAKKEVDGASIPQPFWSFIGGPFSGNYIKASVIHDHYCDVKTRTEHDTHRNLYYGMRAAGVPEWQAKFMYWAVATFGPKWLLVKRVVQELECRTIDENLTCSQVPKFKSEMISLPPIDLGDPDTLAAALSKASAVARSLKTTNGMVLDVTLSGQIAASNLDAISNSAILYRAAFTNKAYIKNPMDLGVLSQWNAAGLDQVQPWEGKQVPRFDEATVLTPTSVDLIETGKSFKLGPNSSDLLRDRINLRALEMQSSGPGILEKGR